MTNSDASASLGGLASHDVDGGPNTLVLLSIGEPQPIPLPSNTGLPINVLQLDVLQLEFALLTQAQRQNVPGVGDRRQPFVNLRQLLHHLQIPVAPHAPLGNAGNEAFYTVLAFQKLLMRDTRLPDQLFVQPQFVQPEYYVPPPAFPAAPYSVYGNLPMPPPIRPDGQRKPSSPQLNNRMSMMSLPQPEYETPSFPAPLSREATGESASGRRPATIALNQDDFGPNGGSRQPGRPTTLPRSQSVYWDDSEYSTGRNRSQAGQNGANQPASPDIRAHRSSGAPPSSSLRHSQILNGSSGAVSGLANSRSVSFYDDRRPPTVRSQGSSSGQSKESASIIGSRTNSGTALGPSHLSHVATGSGSGGTSGSGSGSASSGLVSEASSAKVEENKVKKKKSDKSVKHLTGALAKFWVD